MTSRSSQREFDVAIIGGGLAGLSLAARLSEPRFSGLRVLVVEPRTQYIRDRTWSYWSLRPHPFAAAVSGSWDRWGVFGYGRDVVQQAPGIRYETIPSDAFYRVALDQIHGAAGIELRLGATATALELEDGVEIRMGSESVHAHVAFDTRPVRSSIRDGLTQVFGGQEIETAEPVFDPGVATLMDFRCAQSAATHFTYVLPSTSRRALVEDTWFAAPGFCPPDHRIAIRTYMLARYGIERYTVLFEEQGSLAMDPGFRPRAGTFLIPFGTAGGAARPSTGYAFNAVQEQCDRAADQLAAGLLPSAPPARSSLIRIMDGVLLDLLRRQPDLAPRVFSTLFGACDPRALVRFLNDAAGPQDLVAVAAAIPFWPTMGAALRLAAGRIEWPSAVAAG